MISREDALQLADQAGFSESEISDEPMVDPCAESRFVVFAWLVAAHERERLWFVAVGDAEGVGRGEGELAFCPPAGSGPATGQPTWAGATVLGADGTRRRIGPGVFALAHGIPDRVEQLRGYGNAIVPQVAAVFVRAHMEGANA